MVKVLGIREEAQIILRHVAPDDRGLVDVEELIDFLRLSGIEGILEGWREGGSVRSKTIVSLIRDVLEE